MYGILHQSLIKWVLDQDDGSEILDAVLKMLDYEGKIDEFFVLYPDEFSEKFVDAVQETTGVDRDTILFESGKNAVGTLVNNGFLDILRTMGDCFYTMLQNLDSIHFNFLASFPEMKIPSITPERMHDDTLQIHFFGQRPGVAMFGMGSIQESAKALYNLDLQFFHKVKAKSVGEEDIFVAFADPTVYPPDLDVSYIGMSVSNLALNQAVTATLLPWHVAFNRNLKVVSMGSKLAVRIKENTLGQHINKFLAIIAPVDAKWDFDMLCTVTDKPVILSTIKAHMRSAMEYNALLEAEADRVAAEEALKREEKMEDEDKQEGEFYEQGPLSTSLGMKRPSRLSKSRSRGSTIFNMDNSRRDSVASTGRRFKRMHDLDTIKLHGQITYDEEQDILLVVCNPYVSSNVEMEKLCITLKDLPIHTHGREVLYEGMEQARSAEKATQITHKLDALNDYAQQIVEKKVVIDNLLHSILPPQIANSLSLGEIPEAEEYESVSVLYSDIAGFTSISSGVPSIEVMKLLHELFVKFDDLADKHDVYKVETIGDAYMVVAGCPNVCDNHAEKIAAFALDMSKIASKTLSPLDGEPIQIRIGIHSGPVRAGVVGRDRPRYCLFGDTVSVASFMESKGIPGCIQVSYRFLRQLPLENPFLLAPRGTIELKGAPLHTFLLLGYVGTKEDLLFPDREKDPKLFNDVMIFAFDARHRKRTMGHIPQLVGRPLETQMEAYKRRTMSTSKITFTPDFDALVNMKRNKQDSAFV
eukprot:m.13529 g.13529  ORF g.13529 m.13529 type:complete len:755 (+) comp4165_c0_seq2:237-2501(+)